MEGCRIDAASHLSMEISSLVLSKMEGQTDMEFFIIKTLSHQQTQIVNLRLLSITETSFKVEEKAKVK